MYAPSYWYVEMLGYVRNPQLEIVAFMLILDIGVNRRVRSGVGVEHGMRKKGSGEYEVFCDEHEGESTRPKTGEEKIK